MPTYRPPNPYEIIGCPRDADAAAMKRAYRARALEWHPDRNGNSDVSNHRFKLLTYSYELLTDDVRRFDFDRTGISLESPPSRPAGVPALPAEEAAEALGHPEPRPFGGPRPNPYTDPRSGWGGFRNSDRERRQQDEEARERARRESAERARRENESRRKEAEERKAKIELNRLFVDTLGARKETVHDILRNLHLAVSRSKTPEKVTLPRGLTVVISCNENNEIEVVTLSRRLHLPGATTEWPEPSAEETKLISLVMFGFNDRGNLNCVYERVEVPEDTKYKVRVRLRPSKK